MRALVIGASGGVGSAVFQRLEKNGWDVTGHSRAIDGFDVGKSTSEEKH
ncbi:MAG: NAD-dependent epimerase/dehydratase family protein, partial [Paracoccaceae bacterium]|nr:NAD-dependent epimerase/dehydratase family protein [Paracoccaceae bacterium]